MEINQSKIVGRLNYNQEMEINTFINNYLETKNEVLYYTILNILPVAAGI